MKTTFHGFATLLVFVLHAFPATAAQQVVVTDREGRTYVGSTAEPEADPLVLETPNGPVTIPRAEIASVSSFVIPSTRKIPCVCGCPTFGKIERVQEFLSVMAGTAIVVSVRLNERWFFEGDQSFVSYDQPTGTPAAGLFVGYSWMLWDRRQRGGTSTWEVPVEVGWRDQEVGEQPVRYRGFAGLTGVAYTRWFATRFGLRMQVLLGADQWIGPRPWFTEGNFACDCPADRRDPYEYRLARLFPGEYRVVLGLAF